MQAATSTIDRRATQAKRVPMGRKAQPAGAPTQPADRFSTPRG